VQDTTPPPAPSVSAPPSLTKSRTVALTIGDTEADVAITCELTGPGGASVVSGSCPSDGVFDTTGYGDGTYTLVVTATDPAGNTTTTTVTWLRDTTPPVPPVVQAPTSPAQGRSPSFTVTEPESPVTWTCDVSGPSVVAVSQCGPTVVLDLNGAADGVYTVSVVAIDPAGNPSLAGTATYTLDTTPPPAPQVSAPPALTRFTPVTVTISDAQPDAVLTCVVTSPDSRTVFSGACPVSGTFDTVGFGDGVYTLVVTATDSAGNASTTTVTWRRDTQPPPVPTVTAPASPGNSRTPSLTVTEPESPVTFTCTVSGPSSVTVTACGLTVTLDLIGASDGTYTVFVTATDPAGNVSAAGSVSWVLDTTPPPAPAVTAPQSPGNSRHPSFTVTDPEAGVQWTCGVTGPSPVAITSCGPATVLDMTGSPDGTYTLTVSAVDAAGNVSAVTKVTYTLDTTPPPAPVVTAPASPSHDLTPTYGISDGEIGAQLTCVLTGPNGTVFTGPCPVDGTFDTTGFGDGLYTLTVTAADAAGNASSTSGVWTRDTVAPPAPGVSAPSSPAQGRTVTFSVTDAEAGVIYTCVVSGPSAATVTSCGPSAVLNLVGAADGSYTLTVTATDAADNTSTATSATYVLDTTSPVAPSVSATPSPAQGRHVSYTIAGVEQNGVLTCKLVGPGGSSAVMSGSCGTTVGVDLTGQPDGTYTLTVTVTDAAGNVSAAGSASYVLDTTAPTAPIIGGHASPGNDTSPSFGISTESGATLTCTVARYFQVVSTGPCGPGGTVDLSGYDDGEFEITVFATDAAGNVGPSATVVYLLDTSAPETPALTSPASPSPVEKPVWVFTAEEGTTATCTVTGPGGQVVQGPLTCLSPFTGQFKNLPDGTYVLTVVVTDAAGNASTAATSVFILDRHAPVPPTVLPPSSPDSTAHPLWTISGPKGAALTCTLMNGRKVISGPAACPATGAFSLSGMPDGTYTLRVTATDSAGNVSATSVTTYVLDTSRPATPGLAYSSPTPSVDPEPYWGFTLPAGTVGRCELLRDGVVLASKSNCKGAVSFDLTGRPVGTYTLRVYAIDAAGNVSRPMVASYVLGARQPSPPPLGSLGGSPAGNPFGGGGGGGHGGNGPTLGTHQVQQALQAFADATTPVGAGVKKAAHAVHHIASSIIPVIHDQVTEHVSKAVQGVVNAVSQAGGGTGFPLLLLFVVLAFLLMQNRIDRRDPKLALASVAADDTVEFQPPPSRRSPRAKGKGADG
jgi:large repetitive protein